mgnify:CR=1 FL=1
MTNVIKPLTLDEKIEEIQQNLAALKEVLNRIGVSTEPEPPSFEVVWEGRLIFDVSAENNASAIEWVINELKDFCAGSNAQSMTKGYAATKIED